MIRSTSHWPPCLEQPARIQLGSLHLRPELIQEARYQSRARPTRAMDARWNRPPKPEATPEGGLYLVYLWSGRPDSNRRPQRPEISRGGLGWTALDQNRRSEYFADCSGLPWMAPRARWTRDEDRLVSGAIEAALLRQATSRSRRMASLVVVWSAAAQASIASRSSGSIRTGTTSAGPDPIVGRPPLRAVASGSRGADDLDRRNGLATVDPASTCADMALSAIFSGQESTEAKRVAA